MLCRTHLSPGRSPKVASTGPQGAVDESVALYGTILRLATRFTWYTGNHGPLQNNIGYERVDCLYCYATSKDGVTWVKPKLGLVEFNGSKDNNIIDSMSPTLWSTFAVLHDPEPRSQQTFQSCL